jgi:hypothetical protein
MKIERKKSCKKTFPPMFFEITLIGLIKAEKSIGETTGYECKIDPAQCNHMKRTMKKEKDGQNKKR